MRPAAISVSTRSTFTFDHDAFGRRPRELIEQARTQIAQAIGATPASIVWTSGATESDNLALSGVAKFHGDRGKRLRCLQSRYG